MRGIEEAALRLQQAESQPVGLAIVHGPTDEYIVFVRADGAGVDRLPGRSEVGLGHVIRLPPSGSGCHSGTWVAVRQITGADRYPA